MLRSVAALAIALILSYPLAVQADISGLAKASVMGLRLGDTYNAVCESGNVGTWSGSIGNPRFRASGTLRTIPPAAKEPYDAQLDPPEGIKYLGGDLRDLNLYFDYKGGDFRLFAIAFKVDGVPLDKVLTKQFGPMTTGSGWANDTTMLLLHDNEVLLFDISARGAAEMWYYKNQKNFSPQR